MVNNMRSFDYRVDYKDMSIEVNNYIDEMLKELKVLSQIEKLDIYDKSIQLVEKFKEKYPDILMIQDVISKDMLSSENIEYVFEHKNYKQDASKTGMDFQNDLYKIFELEDELSNVASKLFKEELSSFEEIENGKEFLVVGHASYNLPGVSNNKNYRNNYKKYLSCSVYSNNELNTFMDEKIVYLFDVNKENFISSSPDDVATREEPRPSMHTLKKNDSNSYTDVGIKNDPRGTFALSILSPRAVEKLSVEREFSLTNKKYSKGITTNEVVLYRPKCKSKRALLIADETDLLINEYFKLKENKIKFKCINRGIYKEMDSQKRYSQEQLDKLIKQLSELPTYNPQFLSDYYNEVVLPMNYSDEILSIINDSFKQYIKHSKKL